MSVPAPHSKDVLLFGNRAVSPKTDNATLKIGKWATAKKLLDVFLYGASSAAYAWIDASASLLELVGITQSVGAGSVLNFTGTGYMSPLGSIRNRVQFFDDFLGDLIEDGWNQQADTGGTVALATAPGNGGIVTLTTDTTDDDTIMIAHELNWKASQGLVFEVRFKLDVITGVGLYMGFTDAKVETSPALPVTRQTTVSVKTATDAVGFCFDTDSTTDVIFGTGVKADTLIADQGASTDLTAATFITLRVEVSAAGAASFYVNGTQIGATTANAVTTTVALTPYIGMANRAAAAHVLSVDYVYVEGARA